MIKIDSVSKSFGDKLVLDGINLTLKEPTIYGLVGINGSGKSTLLRIIAGIYRPDQGRVTIDGEDVLQNPEKAKSSFFFLNDNPYYSPLWKAKDFVSFYSCFYPEFDKEELNRVLNILELDVSHRISTFSKGMKRQFFLALAFASGAKTLLFDEAFEGGARFVITCAMGGKPFAVVVRRDVGKETEGDGRPAVCSHRLGDERRGAANSRARSWGKEAAGGKKFRGGPPAS